MNSLKVTSVFFSVATVLSAQDTEINTRLSNGELKMNFPGIYFIHNSTYYATMPYTVDSCFKYIAAHVKDIKSYVIWRDSIETEGLTGRRIRKLRDQLNCYTPAGRIHIQSLEKAQKISRRTISLAEQYEQTQFLLSLNSVFEVSASRVQGTRKVKKICWYCLIHGKRCQINTFLFSKLRVR